MGKDLSNDHYWVNIGDLRLGDTVELSSSPAESFLGLNLAVGLWSSCGCHFASHMKLNSAVR